MFNTHPPIRLIALDIDGTLLDSQHELPPANRRAIDAARARGVQVVLATGKSIFALRPIHRELDLDTPSVCVQGLMVYGPDESIWHERRLDPATVGTVTDYALDHDLTIFAYERDRLLVNRPSPYIDHFVEHFEPRAEVLADFAAEMQKRPINKLNIMHPDEGIPRIRADLAARLGESTSLVQAVPQSLEILPAGASKGEGLRWLLDRLEIDPARVLAVGDGENDVEMMTLAGVGVAVANAMPAAKAAADHRVASNDAGGVAEAIERFVLAGADFQA